MPDRAYIPQRTDRHPEGTFDDARAEADEITSTPSASRNTAWLFGLDLIETGFFWEAHEVLEAVWLASPQNSAERMQVQAVIQLANAALKLAMGRDAAALRLCGIAETLTQDARRVSLGRGTLDAMELKAEVILSAIESVRTSARSRGRITLQLSLDE